jgi:hypothetical protein
MSSNDLINRVEKLLDDLSDELDHSEGGNPCPIRKNLIKAVPELVAEICKWQLIARNALEPPITEEDFIEELDSYFCHSGDCSGDCYRDDVEWRAKSIYGSLFNSRIAEAKEMDELIYQKKKV